MSFIFMVDRNAKKYVSKKSRHYLYLLVFLAILQPKIRILLRNFTCVLFVGMHLDNIYSVFFFYSTASSLHYQDSAVVPDQLPCPLGEKGVGMAGT